MSFLDLFKTHQTLPMFHYSTKNAVHNSEHYEGLILDKRFFPIIPMPSLDDLWLDVNLTESVVVNRRLRINVLRNDVLRRTRLGVGNILFVANEEEKSTLDVEFTRYPYGDLKIIVDESLQPNEFRTTYWEIDRDSLRGGFQISPEGFSCIQLGGDCWQDYRDFFLRGFL